MHTLKIAMFHGLMAGGAKRSLLELANILSRKHIIDIYDLSLSQDDLFDLRQSLVRNRLEFKFKKLFFKRPFGFLNAFLVFLNRYRLNRLEYNMAGIVNKGGYDSILLIALFYDYAFAPDLLRYLKIPAIYFCHEPCRQFYEQNIDYKEKLSFKMKVYNLFFSRMYKLYKCYCKIIDQYNIKQADLVLCNSYYAKEYINKAYGLSARVNYLGVDTQKFKPMNTPKENLVISVGHLHPRKAHDFVIKAIAEIPASIRPKFVVVYPNVPYVNITYKRYLEDLADKNKVEISFLGEISDEELVILYNKAKLTACAFIMEPFGLIPLESMACQTPVVAIGEAGLKESVINNETGILTKRGIEEFSRAIEYLLKDEEVRMKMGKAGRQYVLENWTWNKSAEELETNLLSVIKNG